MPTSSCTNHNLKSPNDIIAAKDVDIKIEMGCVWEDFLIPPRIRIGHRVGEVQFRKGLFIGYVDTERDERGFQVGLKNKHKSEILRIVQPLEVLNPGTGTK